MLEENLKKIQKIYFIGIKGVGMAGLAIIAKEAGFMVQGSDVPEEFLTDRVLKKHDIKIDEGFSPESLSSFCKGKPEELLVIVTAAHDGLSNPQAVFAAEHHISILTHGQAVGEFMEGSLFKRKFKGISILGCHGKTTITAMIAIALRTVGKDPSYAVGTSEIFPKGDAGHFGTGAYFVAEADEFISDVKTDRTVKFLYQKPDYGVINNIDFDHPDVYKDLEEVVSTFRKFCLENIQPNGVFFMNGDDKEVLGIKESVLSMRPDVKVITYGEGEENNIQILNFKELGWGSEFEVLENGENLGVFKLSVPGYHNAKNSLAVLGLLRHLEVDIEGIKRAMAAFTGTKRRQEMLGKTSQGAEVIDDYAHHPEEIDKTLKAVKKAFPEKQIIAIFQPHTLSRTVSLMHEFSHAFSSADSVLFLPIFTSKREGEVAYEDIYTSIEREMKKEGVDVVFMKDERATQELEQSPYFYPKNRQSVIKYIELHYDSDSHVLVTLGAGDIYRLGYDLVKANT